jgi:hypothetical protein
MTPYAIRMEIRKLGVLMRALTSAPVHITYKNNAGNGVTVTGVNGLVKNTLEYYGEEIQDWLEQEVVSYQNHCAVIIVVGTTGMPAFYLPAPPQDPAAPPTIWPPLPPQTPIADEEGIWVA